MAGHSCEEEAGAADCSRPFSLGGWSGVCPVPFRHNRDTVASSWRGGVPGGSRKKLGRHANVSQAAGGMTSARLIGALHRIRSLEKGGAIRILSGHFHCRFFA